MLEPWWHLIGPEQGFSYFYLANAGNIEFIYWAIAEIRIRTVGINVFSYDAPNINAETGLCGLYASPSEQGITIRYLDEPVILRDDLKFGAAGFNDPHVETGFD